MLVVQHLCSNNSKDPSPKMLAAVHTCLAHPVCERSQIHCTQPYIITNTNYITANSGTFANNFCQSSNQLEK